MRTPAIGGALVLLACSLIGSACSLMGDTGEPAAPGGPDGVAFPTPDAPPNLPPANPLRLLAPPFDVATTTSSLDAWPLVVPGLYARATTSFDRSGGNDDGFAGTYSELYVDARGQHVVFDESGPGVLRTLWLTSAIDGDGPLALGLLRFYFDDEEKPRIEIDADRLFAGTSAPFVKPLVAASFTTSGGYASWAPLPYRKRLRITTERRAGFYQAHYDVLPADWDIQSYALGTTDSMLAARFTAAAEPSTLPLEEAPLDTIRTGAGIVDVLRFVPTAPPSDADLASARIQIWFDGATEAHVDVPFGFFFGSGLGVAPVHSVAWTMRPSLFESRFPMPYWMGARIAVTGIDGKLYLHTRPQTWSRAEAGTFEARFHEETPTTSGTDFVYADVTGSGKLVATVLGVDPLAAANKRWWEGDLRSSVDGARSPQIHGTGHEDDHLGGWSNEFFSRPFSLPMQGAPRTDLLDTGAEFQKNGSSTMYRLWPGLPFLRSLRHSTEHGPESDRILDYRATSFLYRRETERTVLSDAFDVADRAAASAHAYDAKGVVESVVTSAFEGERSTELTASVHEYSVPVTFALAVDPDNDGAVIRRTFDHAEAPLRSTLDVDGIRIRSEATWGPVAPNRTWSERDIFIPAQVTRGKSKLTIRWTPDTTPKAQGLSPRRSNAARFELWSIRPPR